jgi:Zn-dependent metalloprotease
MRVTNQVQAAGNSNPVFLGPGDDSTLYSGRVNLKTKRNADGSYSLEGMKVRVLDMQNRRTGPGVPLQDLNDTWGETTDPASHKGATDVLYGLEVMQSMMTEVFGRDSLDGRGGMITANVHVGERYNNAFWSGRDLTLNLGDGDGRNLSPLVSVDIVAHEVSHGLIQSSAGLAYQGEAGALNESYADIFGTGAEWYASQTNDAVKFDYAIGEDVLTPGIDGDALRYMDDPSKDNYSIDHYSKFRRGHEVHSSSGIANNAFYLVTHGGVNKTSGEGVENPIGMEKGLKIFYKALVDYMTPNTSFAQARAATIQAATDLYGASSDEVEAVKEAWTAVGVA